MKPLVPALLALALASAPARADDQDPQPSPAVPVAKDAILPHLAIDAEGAVAIVFLRNGNVEISVSTDRGKTFSAPVPALDAKGRATGGMQRGPRVAVDGAKKIYVTAALPSEPTDKSALPTHDLYLVVSADHGKSFSKPRLISDPPGGAAESLHWTAVSPTGELHVAWLDSRPAAGPDLLYARITESAKKPSKPSTLAAQVCERCAPGLALDGKGSAFVVYREGGGKKNRRVLLASSTNAGRSFAKPAPVNQVETGVDTCPQDAPAVAVSADGKTIAVAWMDLRDFTADTNVYWTINRDGKFPAEVPVHDERRFAQGHPSLAVEPDGTVWCAWEDGRHVKQCVYVANSSTRKNVRIGGAKDPKAGAPSIATGGGLVGVACESGDGVAFRTLATR